MKLQLHCEMLIDQGRYIGSDPVGHACHNVGTHTFNGYVVCLDCVDKIKNEPERITFPSMPLGINGQVEIYKNLVEATITKA